MQPYLLHIKISKTTYQTFRASYIKVEDAGLLGKAAQEKLYIIELIAVSPSFYQVIKKKKPTPKNHEVIKVQFF